MNEIKTPKKPMMFYYGIFLAVIILFNAIVLGKKNQITEVQNDSADNAVINAKCIKDIFDKYISSTEQTIFYADMLAEKTNEDLIAEKKKVQKELDRAIARNEDVARLYERLYEDNVSGKVTDEWFMQLSNKYESERLELKTKIQQHREQLSNLGTMQKGKEQFISAVRKFMQMETLTAPLLKELIDKIVIYEMQGTGKYRTQRIVIYYRFVGYLEILLTESEWEYYRANTRQGVAVEYISRNIPA